jgi:hypothetical protein
MNEIERLIVRRIAVEMEQRQRIRHDASIGRWQRRKSRRGNAGQPVHKKGGSRRAAACFNASLLAVEPALLAAALLTALAGLALAALLLAGLVLPALLLLTGFVLAALLRIALLLLVALRIVLLVRHRNALRDFEGFPRPVAQPANREKVPRSRRAPVINQLI